MQRWEYTVLQVVPRVPIGGLEPGVYLGRMRRAGLEHLPVDDILNEVGNEGWELAGVLGSADVTTFYLKRPRP
jgi:hypothetical protein